MSKDCAITFANDHRRLAQQEDGSAAPPSANQKANADLSSVIFFADLLDDMEHVRIANENRLRAMVQVKGLPEVSPDTVLLRGFVKQLAEMEKKATKRLERALKDHPLGTFVTGNLGIGFKSVARLLGLIGDPASHSVEKRPRRLYELWAYCGLHVIDGAAAKRKKGTQSNWSTRAKTRAFVIAEVAFKRGVYRPVYLARREHTATTHPDWTKGHSHNDALRIVMKRMLRDLWVVARQGAE